MVVNMLFYPKKVREDVNTQKLTCIEHCHHFPLEKGISSTHGFTVLHIMYFLKFIDIL